MFDEAAQARVKELICENCNSIGDFVESVPLGEDVYEMRYENLTRGYRGWFWAAAVTAEASVLEVYPVPGPDALLLPTRQVRSRQIVVDDALLKPTADDDDLLTDDEDLADDESLVDDEGLVIVDESTDLVATFDRDGVNFEEE